MQWMVLPFSRYAVFTGRSCRMEYWMFVLFNVILTAALMCIVLGFVPFVGLLVSIAFVVVLALPGIEGGNRFGPDPKGVDEAEVFA